MVEPNVPLLQDLNQYLQRNGIEEQHDDDNQSTLDQREFASRIKDEESYKDKILHEFLKRDEGSEKENKEIQQKKQFLEFCLNKSMGIITAERTIRDVSLFHLVDKCDTIYAFVSSSDHWSGSAKNIDSGDGEKSFSFSLKEFDDSSIEEFLALVEGTKKAQDISPECIIECCRIAHYLQSESLLEEIADVIKVSIDADNCACICILADQLQMPGLLQSSMRFVMDTLDKIEKNEIWDDFPESLKHHVLTLRNAAQSSIIARGSQSKVFFSSSHEFLGIFSDTLREHKERLNEAKMRQEEIIQERTRLNEARGRYAQQIDVRGGSVKDAAIKIEKQERRVQTLEAFYREQKAIFSRDATHGGAYKSSFSL
eukprot:CAMPEP_0203663346 /NCGR_PEP_ID=MMETSP0090-20130426/956_1 /ASSEMBLY_ACC=CAM_ASM_001088 /TAXON_ID=426623 /ORGANISM="Chaetoceros affinis, Strain CCMP159" /LENGTH=369 /DNA_ID=CAMNT_0050526233 /DNA_START=17 /DNA_END=1126 /DNA_ORIENTATION=+